MVATTTRGYAYESALDPQAIKPLNVPQIRHKKSLRAAERVLGWLETREGESPGEVELFVALQAAAFQGVRKRRGQAFPSAENQAWTRRWKTIRDHLIERNLGLVYTMISRFNSRDLDWDDQRSDALYAMIRAVDGYNPWSGFRFSTYACNTITRALIHLAKRTTRHRSRFPMEHESWLENPPVVDGWYELYADRLHRAMVDNLGELTDREAAVLGWRFPLRGGKSLTLGEVGAAIGLSKERARQIQEEALGKLRAVLEADAALQ